MLVRGGTDARVIGNDRLLYYRAGTVFGLGFDARARATRGGPVPVIEGIQSTAGGSGAGLYSVGDNGTLVFVPGGGAEGAESRRLVWVDRQGKEEPIPAPGRSYVQPRLSPDGTRIVVVVEDGRTSGLWMWEIGRQVFTRITPAGDRSAYASLWTTDGRGIVYRSTSGPIFGRPTKVFDGRAYLPVQFTGLDHDVSPDGQRFLMIARADAAANPEQRPTITIVTHWVDELKARVK